MQFKLIIISLIISFSSFAEVDRQSILTSLFDTCFKGGSPEKCGKKVIGKKKNKEFFLKSIKSVNSYTAFKATFIKTYGKEEFDKYSSKNTLTLLPLSSKNYQIEYYDSNNIIFKGYTNKKVSLIKFNNSWVFDLDNSSITPPENSDISAMSDMADLLIGSLVGLTKFIHTNPDVGLVHQMGTLYHLTILYDALDSEQQNYALNLFKEKNTNLNMVKSEILAHIN